MPLGALKPLTQSTAMILPSRPTLAIDPLLSLPQGSPSMLET